MRPPRAAPARSRPRCGPSPARASLLIELYITLAVCTYMHEAQHSTASHMHHDADCWLELVDAMQEQLTAGHYNVLNEAVLQTHSTKRGGGVPCPCLRACAGRAARSAARTPSPPATTRPGPPAHRARMLSQIYWRCCLQSFACLLYTSPSPRD